MSETKNENMIRVSPQLPRDWLAGNATATAIANGCCVLFPRGEKFFIRSVRRYVDHITDASLRQQVRRFFQQETSHAKAHTEMNDVLRAQGFALDRILARYEQVLSWSERTLSPALNLAGTTASEHFTAVFSEAAFVHQLFDAADPSIAQLLAWHAAEEIDHKSVAFDVLQLVAPSYWLRILGLVHALVIDGIFVNWAVVAFLREHQVPSRRIAREVASMMRDPIALRVLVAGIRQYLQPHFHPRDNGNEHHAEAWFALHKR